MKIRKVKLNNRKKCIEVETAKRKYDFPYSKLDPKPSVKDRIQKIYVDPELAKEGFTFILESEKEGSHVLDEVLDYNKDPDYLRKMLLYKLSIRAQKLLKASRVSKREVIRRMDTSPTQFYRLIDQTNYKKTIDQMIKLLAALDCPVDIVFKNAA